MIYGWKMVNTDHVAYGLYIAPERHESPRRGQPMAATISTFPHRLNSTAPTTESVGSVYGRNNWGGSKMTVFITFDRQDRRDGTIESICILCHKPVTSGRDLMDLIPAEIAHSCDFQSSNTDHTCKPLTVHSRTLGGLQDDDLHYVRQATAAKRHGSFNLHSVPADHSVRTEPNRPYTLRNYPSV
jgi:hypothetical protein